MMSETESEQFSLRWNNFHSNLTSGFHALLQGEDLVDVTLAAGGQFVQAHKIVLSVCSPYFKDLFKVNPCKHPIVILKDVCHKELVAILQFMYRGEVNVRQEELATFLKTAEMLQIKGLTGDDSLSEEESVPFPPTPVRTKAPRRTAEKTPQSVRATPEKKQPVAPVPEIITAEPEESSTPQYKRMRSETSAPVLNSPVVSEETSTVELMEISNPKQEPVEYESEIEEVERLQNRDESLVQLLGGESSQTLQDSSQDDDDDHPLSYASGLPPRLYCRPPTNDPDDRLIGGTECHRMIHVPSTGQKRNKAMRKCRVCYRHGKKRRETSVMCAHCGVALCKYPCFYDYHTKENY